jgi:HlyD family secretion protein
MQEEPMKRKIRARRTSWLIWATVLALVAAIVLTGCARPAAANGVAAQDTTVVLVGALSDTVSASGKMVAQRDAALSFSAPGRVTDVWVEVGDFVQAGDPLAQLETDALQTIVRSAELSLAAQETNLAELLSPAEDDELVSARASVASAQAQLDDHLAGATELERADAQASLASAQAQLDDLLEGASATELAQAQASLASAQAALEVEQANYAALADQFTVARVSLDLAAVDLKSAQYFYDALKNDWQHKDYADFSPEAETLQDAQAAYDVALARYTLAAAGLDDSALSSAEAQIAQAQANLEALTEEQTVAIAAAREQVARAQAGLEALTEERTTQVASARAKLAQAEASLINLAEGASDEAIAAAQAQVEQARLHLADAQERLDRATLRAPWSGVVSAVHVEVGEWANGLAVALIDTDSLHLELDVDESDIQSITLGQPATITLETWPDRELAGQVTTITPRAQTQSGIVTYEVHVQLDTQDLAVRAGMTADADLNTASQENVLLVANKAITADRTQGVYYVYRRGSASGDDAERVEITIGGRDKDYSEVTSGLQEGDELLIDYVQEAVAFGPGQGE